MHTSLMIKPASSSCDLNCSYCFYRNISSHRKVASHGLMDRQTMEAVIANIFFEAAPDDTFAIAFQGGEPTLAGLPFFHSFTEAVRVQQALYGLPQTAVQYALQTNGMRIEDDWCAFLTENDFLVGLSIDGYAAHHNQHRVDFYGKGTFARAMNAKRMMEQAGVEYNILCTLTNTLARHPQKIWRFLAEERIKYIQLTPCLGELGQDDSPWALSPQRFHRFYSSFFSLWKQAAMQGNYVSIKLFDDIVNLFVRKQATACGIDGSCQIQNIVEADASTYPCDFYALDEYQGLSLATNTLKEVRRSLTATGFLSSRKSLPAACSACHYQPACKGGCKRMASAIYVDPATGFCGFRHLLDDIGQELCEIGSALLRQT